MLSVDEAQDIRIDKFDKEIAPMAASTNATRVFWGTAWRDDTLLARELQAARESQKRDGIQRTFVLNADQVAKEVPAYGLFVRQQIERLGRDHPMVRTQFFSEVLQQGGGLFHEGRLALLQGDHSQQSQRKPTRFMPCCWMWRAKMRVSARMESEQPGKRFHCLDHVQIHMLLRLEVPAIG